MTIRYVVLDYDGTCTNIAAVAEAFLAEYRRLLEVELAGAGDAWADAISAVRASSPESAWTLVNPGSAPAAADPYILAYEVEQRILRAKEVQIPAARDTFFKRAYGAPGCKPPWRDEASAVLEGLVAAGVKVWFVSNSADAHIRAELDDLFPNEGSARRAIDVRGGASKYVVGDLAPTSRVSPAQRARFEGLRTAVSAPPLAREILLRRPRYFEALCDVWADDPAAPGDTLVCGDIWELDLAMPEALGCQVHLVTRAAPYGTYEYERRAASGLGKRGGVSADLHDVLDRVVNPRF